MADKVKQLSDLLTDYSKFYPKARERALPDTLVGRPLEELPDSVLEEMAREEGAVQEAPEMPVIQQQSPIEEQPARSIQSVPEPSLEPVEASSAEPEPALEPVQEKPNPLAELLKQYNDTKEQSVADIKEAYEKDRKAKMWQGLISGLGKAITYSQFAGAKTLSAPIPLNIETSDPKFAEEAKEVSKTRLEGLKDRLDLLKSAKSTDDIKTVGGDLIRINPQTGKVEILHSTKKGDELSQKDKMYFDLKEREMQQRMNMFSQSEDRRLDKESIAKMERPTNLFNKDKIVTKAYGRLADSEAAEYILQSKNPIGDEAVKTFLARASGEVGALTDRDVSRFGGSKALTSRISAITKQYADGTLTDENRKYLLQLTDVFKKSADKQVNDRADHYARQQEKVVGIPKHKLKSAFLGRDIPSDEELTDKDKEALDWARKNPKDPRATKILNTLGR